jgi:spermidine/putrescine-binding protein
MARHGGHAKGRASREERLRVHELSVDASSHCQYQQQHPFANPNIAAHAYVIASVKQDLAIYPPQSVMDKLFTVEDLPPAIARLATRLWTKLKTNT